MHVHDERTPLVAREENCDMNESGLLYHASSIASAPCWHFWNVTSSSHRFFLVFLISFIPFGGHFVKNGMSSLEQFMLDDREFPLSNTMYGALISAVSVPNMILPLLGGQCLDKYGHQNIRIFLLWTCIGQVIFALGMQFHVFYVAILGRIVFGIGEGSVVVGARVLIAYWYKGEELTFAMGVGVAIANLSKMLAKSTVAPIAIHFGGYGEALWYGFAICLLSVVVDLGVYGYTQRLRSLIWQLVYEYPSTETYSEWLQHLVRKRRRKIEKCCDRQREFGGILVSNSPNPDSSRNARVTSQATSDTPDQEIARFRARAYRYGCRGRGHRHGHCRRGPYIMQTRFSCHRLNSFDSMFWTLVILHVVFINVFHLFQNVSGSYLYQRYHYSIVKSGLISSLSHSMVMFAPLIGYIIDRSGRTLSWIFAASVLAILAYALLLFTNISPIISMVLMSICLSFTPTILMAAIPQSVPRCRLGIAFGIVEITDGIGAAGGNLIIGYIRDATGSYDTDMLVLLGLAVSTLFLTFFLMSTSHGKGNTKDFTFGQTSTSTPVLSPVNRRSRAFSIDDERAAQLAALNIEMEYQEQEESTSIHVRC